MAFGLNRVELIGRLGADVTVNHLTSGGRVAKARPSAGSRRWSPPSSIRARAGLHDVRIHDIRHSFASRALALGEGLPIIGRLLGHRRIETTARYAHLARDSVKESAERIAVSIAADIL